jgi:hypothetical protein
MAGQWLNPAPLPRDWRPPKDERVFNNEVFDAAAAQCPQSIDGHCICWKEGANDCHFCGARAPSAS